jgi:hypothetical protein
MNKNNAQILFTFTLLLAAFALAACDATAAALRSEVDVRIFGYHTWTVPE